MQNPAIIFVAAGICFAVGVLAHQSFEMKMLGYIFVGLSVMFMIIGGTVHARKSED